MESPSLWWSTAIWEITAHQSIDSDCGVRLSLPRHGGKSNLLPRGETAEREKGTKALHSSATVSASRGSGIPTEQSKAIQQSPTPLAQDSWLQALSPAWALFAVLQKQGREKPDQRSQEESFPHRLYQSSLWFGTSPSPPLPILVSPSYPAVYLHPSTEELKAPAVCLIWPLLYNSTLLWQNHTDSGECDQKVSRGLSRESFLAGDEPH